MHFFLYWPRHTHMNGRNLASEQRAGHWRSDSFGKFCERNTNNNIQIQITISNFTHGNNNNVCIDHSQDLHSAMKMLGLNPMEQEIVDLTNTISKNGFIYFPDFWKMVVQMWREADEDVFRQHMFKVTMKQGDIIFINTSLYI